LQGEQVKKQSLDVPYFGVEITYPYRLNGKIVLSNQVYKWDQIDFYTEGSDLQKVRTESLGDGIPKALLSCLPTPEPEDVATSVEPYVISTMSPSKLTGYRFQGDYGFIFSTGKSICNLFVGSGFTLNMFSIDIH